jgi:transposase-like protein
MKTKQIGVNIGVEGCEAVVGGNSGTKATLDTFRRERRVRGRSPNGGKSLPDPKSLQEAIAYFSGDLDASTEFLAAVRWPDGPQCPACESKSHSYLTSRRIWKCRECGRQYSAKLGTIFEDSPIPLDKWMLAVWMIVNCKNGVSSYEIAKDIEVTQKSAWFMLHRIREAMSTTKGFERPLGNSDGGSGVEIDETFIGGQAKNMHKSRRIALQRARSEIRNADASGHVGKTIVMGMLDRDLREVRAHIIPNVRRETLQDAILKHVKHGSRVFTDEWQGYTGLNYKFVHDVVKHMETYVNGIVHTQGIENFWSLFKRMLKGTYVSVEPFHLQRYADEQAFRFNNRGGKKKHDRITDGQRFRKVLTQIVGKRLTYAQLTGKVGQTPF